MVAPAITVSETRDHALLARWLVRPSILRKLLGENYDVAHAQREFDALVDSSARFFAVSVLGEEKGVIIFKPVDLGWEMHLCLATWFTHTRMAVSQAIEALQGATVIASYDAGHRAVTRLLDDLGFNVGAIHDGIRQRELNLNPAA